MDTIATIETAGGALVVRRYDGTPPGIVAWHGFGLHGGQFGPLARSSGWRIDAPDLPGHGLTTVRPVDLGTTIDAMATWLQRSPPRRLVGYSQGGRLALHLAWRRPELVRSLVMVSAGPGLEDGARNERMAADIAVADLIESEGVSAYVSGWIDHPVFGTTRLDPTARATDRALRLQNTAEGLAAARRGLGQGTVPRVPLPEVTTPILWVAGGLDPAYVEVMSAAAERRGELVHVVPQVGHNLVAEAPDALAGAIASWENGR